jgi:hypothetical protein
LLLAGASAAAEPAILEAVRADGEVLVQRGVQAEERWCLGWNHSVTGFTVLDCFRYSGGRMLLERSHQPDFAAGLGHIPGRGRQVSDGAGGYWIEQIDEPLPSDNYLLRVGSVAVNHRLLIRGEEVSLSEVAAGERVAIRLRPAPPTRMQAVDE